MAVHVTRQSTTLKTKTYESSLVWDIEHFLDYPHCSIDELTSEVVEFKGYDASWELSIFPKTDDDKVALKFKMIEYPMESEQTLLKFEVRAEVTGNDTMFASNRSMGYSRGMYTETEQSDMQPAEWSQDYWPVNEKQEMWCENFIEYKDLPIYYLNGGMLTIYAEAWLKSVEVVNTLKK